MNEVVPKRKRGRPPKVRKDNNALLPIEFPASHLPEPNARQIQFGYKILQNILKLSKTKHLLDKPDESLFGFHNYYSVVPKPIWLNEVLRKFSAQEYLCVNEVIGDIRQVLENCYRFWGAKHKFSKHAFRIEKLLEKELNGVPQIVRDMCTMGISEDDNSTTSGSDSAFFVDEFNSKILRSLEKRDKDEEMLKKEAENSKKDELLQWDSEILQMKYYKKQVIFMPELAEIGHFLQLTHEVLCLCSTTQYEVERMLLMPKESSTLATIMTALLCPTAMRGNLYFKPIMVYEVWTQLLSKKVESWYNTLSKSDNKVQVFVRHGIEPEFWEAVGETNPLLNTDFVSLTFVKKVWLLKTLCTTMFHSNKKIEEYFNSVDENCLRGNIVFEDGKYEYVSVFSPEIRVYRICKSHLDVEGKSDVPLNGQLKEFADTSTDAQLLRSLGKKNKFFLAAYDRESLECLLKTFYTKKKSLSLVKGLLIEERNETKMLEALKSMYIQWEKNKERCATTINYSLKYWIEKDSSPPLSGLNGQKNGERFPNDLYSLGKRQLKRKFSLEELENSSDSSVEQMAEEDNTSDWEEGNIRRSRRKRPRWSRWTRDPFIEDGLMNRMARPGASSLSHPPSYLSPLPIPSLGNLLPPLPDLAPAGPLASIFPQRRYHPPIRNNFSRYSAGSRMMRRHGLCIRRTSIPRPSIVAAAVENTPGLEELLGGEVGNKALEISVPAANRTDGLDLQLAHLHTNTLLQTPSHILSPQVESTLHSKIILSKTKRGC